MRDSLILEQLKDGRKSAKEIATALGVRTCDIVGNLGFLHRRGVIQKGPMSGRYAASYWEKV